MDAKSLIKIAKSLSDPHRLCLLQEIARSSKTKYCDLFERMSMSQPSMSQHVKALVDAGLVESEKVGRYVYLTINVDKLHELERFLHLLKGSASAPA